MEDFDALLLKLLLVLLTSPAWAPFLKALWEEFNEAMAEDGGVFGREPTAKELAAIEQRRLADEDPLIHEAWPSAEERMSKRSRMGDRMGAQDSSKGQRAAAGRAGPGQRRRTAQPRERRAGFR